MTGRIFSRLRACLVATLLFSILPRARAEELAPACKQFRSLAQSEPPNELSALNARAADLKRLGDACKAASPTDAIVKIRLDVAQASISSKKAEAMGATRAVAATAPGITPKPARGPAAPSQATGEKSAPRLGRARVPTQPTPSGPSPRIPGDRPRKADAPLATSQPKVATPAEAQAASALDASRAAWQAARDALGACQAAATHEAPKTCQELRSVYVMAAMVYLEVLTLWSTPTTQEYVEILAPVVGDSAACARIGVSGSAARLRADLADPQTGEAIRRYVLASAELGRSISPERAQALEAAVGRNFSGDALENLVRVWGMQHVEALAHDINELAGTADKVRAQNATKKKLLVLISSTEATPSTCAAKVVATLQEQLKVLYPQGMYCATDDSRTIGACGSAKFVQRAPATESSETGDDAFGEWLRRQLDQARHDPTCPECDGALGLRLRDDNGALEMGARFVFPGERRAKPLASRRRIDCGTKTAPLLAAQGIFKDLVEHLAIVYDSAPAFFSVSAPVVVDASSADPVPIGCGSFATPLPRDVAIRLVELRGSCDGDLTKSLRVALGEANALASPSSGGAILQLQAAPGRCNAAIEVAGRRYQNSWAESSRAAADDELSKASANARNLKAGAELAMCVARFLAWSSAPPREQPPARRATWLDAALAPGLPLLNDESKNNDWIGYTWIAGDSALLLGAVGVGVAAINERNAAARDPSRGLQPANDLLTVSAGLALGFVASRVTSVLFFGHGERHAPESARASSTRSW